jgi:hypothetical protein
MQAIGKTLKVVQTVEDVKGVEIVKLDQAARTRRQMTESRGQQKPEMQSPQARKPQILPCLKDS